MSNSTSAAYLRAENDGSVNVKVWENGYNTLTVAHPGLAGVPTSSADLQRWATRQLQDAGFAVGQFQPQFPDVANQNLDLRAEVRHVPLLSEAAPGLAQSLRAGRSPGR